jgi:secretion/DNA translocation related CpaE-like protein
MPDAPAPTRPLILTADPDLLDDLLRLAAAAGVEAEVFAEPGAAARSWSAAPIVLVGDDVARSCARVGFARGPKVLLVSRDLDDAGVWRRGMDIGATHVVFLPDAESWLVDELVAAAEGLAERGLVVGVVGGRGGAGASTLAAALAVTALRTGLAPMLVDADPLGGGLDLLLGGERVPGLRWPGLADSRGRVARDALTNALPVVADLTVLSWDRHRSAAIPPEAMQSVLDAGARGRDLVIVDLPRFPDPAAEVVLAGADVVLMIVPAEVRAAAAAACVASAVRTRCPDVRLIVRGPAPAGLEASVVASAVGLPLAGVLRPEPGLAIALERGEPPARRGTGPLARLCLQLVTDLMADRGVGPAAA